MASALSAPAILNILPSANANTLTALIPDIYAALDVVSRELVGFIPSALRAPSVERAALGQDVNIPTMGVQTAVNITPAMQVPEPPDNTWQTGQMKLTKARAVPFGFTGEEQRSLNTGGPGYLSARGMVVAQALRTLTNEIELDLAVEAAANASRAYGTPGTTPFTGDQIEDLAQIKKILDDNGAPKSFRSAVLNTSAAAKLITVKNLSRVNEAGSQMTLRQGELLDIFGMSVKDTGQAVNHVKGTGAGATTNAAGYAVGATVITLAAAGTGTILAGDVITFAGDANKYVVVPTGGDADVSNAGTITIAAPGLRQAIPAAATAITVANSYAANVGFSMNALAVAMRPPAIPEEGDLAVDRMLITDPRSGVSFEFAIYLGYKKVRYEVSLVWGVKAIKPEHIALLLG
ncbi:hypothetical protein EOA32_00865 [Mesorhizobium sp. M1A.F.Ca.ET.072.01.1.1]|nr:hypothetical protein EOA32_00865 [Mesorhizobium sp. M1A.F.Ca.ET.072.01.1.1]